MADGVVVTAQFAPTGRCVHNVCKGGATQHAPGAVSRYPAARGLRRGQWAYVSECGSALELEFKFGFLGRSLAEKVGFACLS